MGCASSVPVTKAKSRNSTASPPAGTGGEDESRRKLRLATPSPAIKLLREASQRDELLKKIMSSSTLLTEVPTEKELMKVGIFPGNSPIGIATLFTLLRFPYQNRTWPVAIVETVEEAHRLRQVVGRDLYAYEIRIGGSYDASSDSLLPSSFQDLDKLLISPPILGDPHDAIIRIVTAAKKKSVSHIVLVTPLLEEPLRASEHNVFAKIETHVEANASPYTFVRVGYSTDVFFSYSKFVGSFYSPLGDGKIALISLNDVARCLSVILSSVNIDLHQGRAYNLCGVEPLSGAQMAETFSRVLERKIVEEKVTPNEMNLALQGVGVHPRQAKEFEAAMAHLASNASETSKDVEMLLSGFKLNSFSDTIREEKYLYAAGGAVTPTIAVVGDIDDLLVEGVLLHLVGFYGEQCKIRMLLTNVDRMKQKFPSMSLVEVVKVDFTDRVSLEGSLSGVNRIIIFPNYLSEHCKRDSANLLREIKSKNRVNQVVLVGLLKRGDGEETMRAFADQEALEHQLMGAMNGKGGMGEKDETDFNDIKWTIVRRPFFFFANFCEYAEQIKASKKIEFEFGGKIHAVSEKNVVAVLVNLLISGPFFHKFKTYNLTAPPLLLSDITESFMSALKLPITIEKLDSPEKKMIEIKKFSEFQVNEYFLPLIKREETVAYQPSNDLNALLGGEKKVATLIDWLDESRAHFF